MPEHFSVRVLRNQPSPSAADSAADSDAFLFIFICNYEHLPSASSRGELCKSRGGRPGILFPNKPDHGFCVSQTDEIYSAVLCFRADPLRSSMRFWTSDYNFAQRVFFKYLPKWLQRCLAVTWLVPRVTAAVSAKVLCIPNNHAPVSNVTDFNRRHKVHVCLAVTSCHVHFWQNHRDLLRATVR